MWVVKLGGSLSTDPQLPQWLQVLAELGGGRVTVVCGGGGFADEARRLQKRWQFDDLTAHNMAILAMVQTAYQLNALNPGLRLAVRRGDIDQLLHAGQTALWLPFELQRGQADATTHWGHTSDSIAFDLARRLNAERLIIVKSCEIDPGSTLQQLGRAGVVDPGLAALSEAVAFPIQLLHRGEVETMRALLMHNGRDTAPFQRRALNDPSAGDRHAEA